MTENPTNRNLAISCSIASSNRKISGIGLFLFASFIYLVCMVPFFSAYAGHFTTDLIGPPEDNLQDFWGTWYSQVTLDSHPGGFFHTRLIRFPEGTPLHYQSFAYSNLIVIFVLRKLLFLPVSTPVLVGLHNGMLLLSFYLAAIGAFYLTRRFTRNILSALLGGFIFGFSHFHVAHFLHHMHVATIEYIPFFLICFFGAVETGKARYLAGSIFFYFLSAISCWYYLFYIAYFLGFYYLYRAVKERTLIVTRLVWPVALTLIGVFLLLLPLLVPMFLTGLKNKGVYANPGGAGAGAGVFVADLLGYFVFDPYHLLSSYSQPIYSHFTGNLWEKTVYLGLVNIALFAWAFVNRKRFQIKDMELWAWGIVVFMLFASGTRFHVYGISTVPVPTGITSFIPFLKNVRTPSRAVVFVYLFLGIGVGLAVDAIIEKYSKSKGMLAGLLAVICLAVFADFYPTRLESTRFDCPPAYAGIAQDNDPQFGLLDLPKDYLSGNRYMAYQACHGKPIVIASLTRSVVRSLADTLETADLDKQQRQLSENKVKYIVIHRDLNLRSYGKDGFVRIEEYRGKYPVVYSDEASLVLRVY